MSTCTVEFVIEPFTEDSPGKHVVSGIEAMEARGLHVTMGPFGSTVTGEISLVSEAIGPMISSAVKGGAQRVLVELVVDQS
jgi:uncharacterized protein YqgV (UPF0045/DUF77 family)